MRRPEFIARQAARPSGLLGQLLGRIMALETASTNQAAAELLELRPTDHVLEVGFGHGATVARVASAAARGHVAGVDVSEEMLRMASRRNSTDIDRGLVDLRLASAERLPYPDGRFDKVLSVHTLYFWREPERALSEIRRVLKTPGRFVLAWRHDPQALRSFPETVYRFHDEQRVLELLARAGFPSARIVRRTYGATVLRLAVASVLSDTMQP